MDLMIISSLAFIAGITVWLLYVIETLENNKPKKQKVEKSLFYDSFTNLCRTIDDKIRTTYFPPFSENNVRVPININYVTIIDVEFANNFKGPYTTVILKFK